jgi:hypothetical protein
MRLVKRVLLDLQLSLEEIDWVFVHRVGNAMKGESMLIILEHTHDDRLVEFIDQVVNFGL